MRPQAPSPDASFASLSAHKRAALARMGLIEQPNPGVGYILPGNGTKQGIWEAYCEKLTGDDLAGISWGDYRRVRKILEVQHLPHPDMVLRLLSDSYAAKLTRHILIRTVGHDALDQAFDRLTEWGHHFTASSKHAGDTGIEFGSLLPSGCRSVIEAAMDREVDEHNPAVTPQEIASLAAIRQKPVQTLCALALAAMVINRRGNGRRRDCLAHAKKLDKVLSGDLSCAAKLSDCWSEYIAGKRLPGHKPKVRANLLLQDGFLRTPVEALIERLVPDRRDEILAQLPALPDRLSSLKAVCTRRLKALNSVAASELQERRKESLEGVLSILGGARNRFAQLTPVLMGAVDAMQARLDRGRSGSEDAFLVEVPELAPTGELTGRSISLLFELRSDAQVREEAMHEAVRSCTAKKHGPSDGTRDAPAQGGKGQGRICLIYRGVAEEDGIEPFWVDLLRLGIFERDDPKDFEAAQRSSEFRKNHDLCLTTKPPAGFLRTDRALQGLVRNARRSGIIIVPIQAIYHAFLYALTLLTFTLKTGARIGEMMQLRLGNECFRVEYSHGAWKPVARLKPKGELTDVAFPLPADVTELLNHCVRFTNARWFSDMQDGEGKPCLPVHAFGDLQRQDIDPAQFIFTGPSHALSAGHLAYFMRLLLVGIARMRFHDGRAVFTSMMMLSGARREAVDFAINHAPNSPTIRPYDVSGALKLGARARLASLWDNPGIFRSAA